MMKKICFLICVFVFIFVSTASLLADNDFSDTEMKVFDENSNLIYSTIDKQISNRFATFLKSGSWYGSNTYYLNLTQEIHFIYSDNKISKWYVDLKKGYYAPLTPPKLAIYRFKKDDFSYIKKIVMNSEKSKGE